MPGCSASYLSSDDRDAGLQQLDPRGVRSFLRVTKFAEHACSKLSVAELAAQAPGTIP